MPVLQTWLSRCVWLLLVVVLLLPTLLFYGIGFHVLFFLPLAHGTFDNFRSAEAFFLTVWMLTSGWGLCAVLWLVFFHHKRLWGQIPPWVRLGFWAGTVSAVLLLYLCADAWSHRNAWIGLEISGFGPFLLMLILLLRMAPSEKFECLIPPPVLAGFCALFMLALSHGVLGARNFYGVLSYVVMVFAAGLAVLGLAVAAAGVWAFKRAQTTVSPLQPAKASALVTAGVFRYTRHPMYLGLALMLLALVMWLGHAINLLVLLGFVAYIMRFQIKPEERALQTLFGDAYSDYKARVRRWI
jgi:protein-S-isoprenylcysteine O-methyltransferase Ste14